MSTDYRSYTVLYVDDEQQNLVTFRYALEDRFHILTASSGREALQIMDREPIAVLLTDQRMPEMTGVELCEEASRRYPDAVRIIVTAYADVHVAIDAINKGQITQYILKPWQNDELAEVLRTAIDFVHVQRVMHDLELRLLRSGPNQTAAVVRDQFIHELTNPLGALLLTCEDAIDRMEHAHAALFAQSPDIATARRELVEALGAQRDAMDVVRALSDMAHRLRRGERLGTEPPGGKCDVARVVDATVRILRRELERHARVELHLREVPPAAIDAAALGRVVLNLLLNATQAISSLPDKPHRVCVALGARDGVVLIEISDSGPGVPEAERERIFEPYCTTREGGSGLGLTVVREVVSQAGGSVTVGEPPDGGASFVVSLPQARPSLPPPRT
jgi:signal transduction histidine kinase